MYDYAWNKMRNYAGNAIGQDEASVYHRRAYGGFVSTPFYIFHLSSSYPCIQGDLQRMNSTEVGAAAAYEAWRNWKAHYGIYGQPISGDRERQREALIGLAVGEGKIPSPFLMRTRRPR